MKEKKISPSSTDNDLAKIYVNKGKHEKLIQYYLQDPEEPINLPELDLMQDFQKAIKQEMKTNASHMFLNLIIGVKEVGYYLAEHFLYGCGVATSTTLANLTLCIGAKLGDKKSQQYLDKNNIPQYIDELADKCVIKINKNTADVKERDVTWEEMVKIAKSFDDFVQEEYNISYYKSINKDDTEMREYYACIAATQDNLNIPVDMIGQSSSCGDGSGSIQTSV